MDEGRKEDIKELSKLRTTAPDKDTLQNIDKAEKVIRDEQHDGWLRSARKSLVEAARTGRKGNIQDIQDTMFKKKHMGMGKTSFKVNISDERHKEIFGK